MSKYHVNQNTGRPNLCKASKKPCPVGGEHFPNKEAAQNHIEEELKKANYSFATVSKKSDKNLSTLENLPKSSTSYHVSSYLDQHVENQGFTVTENIEGPDYYNTSLVEKDGEHYVLRTVGGPYTDFEPLNAYRVRPAEKPQIQTKASTISSTKGHEEVNALIKEVIAAEKPFDPKGWGIGEVFNASGTINIGSSKNKTITREDGSKIYCFNVQAPGEREFQDEPYPVDPGVEFEENGEKQNSRRMDEGYVIFDERSSKGVLLKYEAASEMGYQDYSYEFKRGVLAPTKRDSSWLETPGDMYLLEGQGTASVTYYKNA